MKTNNVRGPALLSQIAQLETKFPAKSPAPKPTSGKVTVRPPNTDHLKAQEPPPEVHHRPVRGREQEGNLSVGRETKPGAKGTPAT